MAGEFDGGEDQFEQDDDDLMDGEDEPWDGFNSDAEADADVLASAGHGDDESYGYAADVF